MVESLFCHPISVILSEGFLDKDKPTASTQILGGIASDSDPGLEQNLERV